VKKGGEPTPEEKTREKKKQNGGGGKRLYLEGEQLGRKEGIGVKRQKRNARKGIKKDGRRRPE